MNYNEHHKRPFHCTIQFSNEKYDKSLIIANKLILIVKKINFNCENIKYSKFS